MKIGNDKAEIVHKKYNKERFIIKLTDTKTNTQQVLCNSCLMNLSTALKNSGS
jgi:hypothetical protein